MNAGNLKVQKFAQISREHWKFFFNFSFCLLTKNPYRQDREDA